MCHASVGNPHKLLVSNVGNIINDDLWVAVWKEISVLRNGGRSGGKNALFIAHAHLKLSTVTLLALLHVAVATFLPAVEHLDLRHVEQTHPDAFLEAGRQVLLAAAAEHRGEGIPASERNVL